MKDRPIIFNAEMVRAILEGRKTQTRRVIKPQPPKETEFLHKGYSGITFKTLWSPKRYTSNIEEYEKLAEPFESPLGIPGDKLWVREAHALVPATAFGGSTDDGVNQLAHRVSPDGYQWAVYREGWTRCKPGRWRPSIYMPRWASRIDLLVKDIRVERVQGITEDDAISEGICKNKWGAFDVWLPSLGAHSDPDSDPRVTYMDLWDEINEDKGYPWDSNPWVWVVEFELVK